MLLKFRFCKITWIVIKLRFINKFVNKVVGFFRYFIYYFYFFLDIQLDFDFSIVARVEVFIVGWGLDEVFKRFEVYFNVGVDVILMYSKKFDFLDIEVFVKVWNNQVYFMIFFFLEQGLILFFFFNNWVNCIIDQLFKILK